MAAGDHALQPAAIWHSGQETLNPKAGREEMEVKGVLAARTNKVEVVKVGVGMVSSTETTMVEEEEAKPKAAGRVQEMEVKGVAARAKVELNPKP